MERLIDWIVMFFVWDLVFYWIHRAVHKWPNHVPFAKWHMDHHRHTNKNMSVVVPVWDFIFDTQHKKGN